MAKKSIATNYWRESSPTPQYNNHLFYHNKLKNSDSTVHQNVKPDLWVDRISNGDSSSESANIKQMKEDLQSELQWNLELLDGIESQALKKGQTIEQAFSFNRSFISKYKQFQENINRINRQLSMLMMAEKRNLN